MSPRSLVTVLGVSLALLSAAAAQEGAPRAPRERLRQILFEPKGTLPNLTSLLPCVVSPTGDAVLFGQITRAKRKRVARHALWTGGDEAVELLEVPRLAHTSSVLPPAVFSSDGREFLLATRDENKRISAYRFDRGGGKRKLPASLGQVTGLAFVGSDALVLETNRWQRPPGFELRRYPPSGPARVLAREVDFSADRLQLSPAGDKLLLRLFDAEERIRLRVLDLGTGQHQDSAPLTGSYRDDLALWLGRGLLSTSNEGKVVRLWSDLSRSRPRTMDRPVCVLDSDHVVTIGARTLIERISDGARFESEHRIRGGRGRTLVYVDDEVGTTFVGTWSLGRRPLAPNKR